MSLSQWFRRGKSASFISFISLALTALFNPPAASAQRPLGIDVYDGDGTVNWSNAKNNSSIAFAWTKATQGAPGQYVSQSSFPINENNAKSVGIYIGAYHFAQPNRNSPTAEESYFWSVAGNYIKADGLTFMPMLDMEVFTGITSATSYTDWANQWCSNDVAHAYAQGAVIKPFIYVSACNAGNFNTGIQLELADIANYGSGNNNPQTGTPWSACAADAEWGAGVWHVWQYSSTTAVSGLAAPGDVDVWNGTLANMIATAVATPVGPTITSQPASFSVPPGTNVNFTVSATTSGGTLHYQWSFAGTNLAAATTNHYAIADAELTNAGGYSVVVSDNNGSITSAPAFLSVIVPQTNQPNATTVAPVSIDNWWPAEGSGRDIYGSNTITPQGGLVYGPGKIGAAFRFNGTNAYLTSGLSSVAAPWTICMWVNRAAGAAGTSARLFDDGTYSLKLEQFSNTFQVGISKAGTGGGDYTFPTPYTAPTNTWVHLTFVGTTSGTTLYVNGVSKGTLTNSFALPRAYIGAGLVTSSGKITDFMAGSLDEIMIFGRALGVSEINSIFSSGTNGLVRAAILSSFSQPDINQFQLNLKGETGKTLTIYTSTNLSNWISLGTINNISGSTHYTDTNATNLRQFYRVSQP